MIALEAKNIALKYRTINKTRKTFTLNKMEDFWALKDISFKINEGEVVGIIGQNGSGKSTLLKVIANIFAPDKGIIDLHGNTVGLLSLGIGFDNNLSGYENIFLSGMLLGFDKKYIESVLNEIIEFSELKEFIHKPVKTYSSGMYSKLAFSIMIHLKSNILLIDEVLSVGDIRFKEKSYNAILKLIEDKKRTVLIVSHMISSIREICDKILWIDEGRVMGFGDPNEILDEYKKFMKINDDKKMD